MDIDYYGGWTVHEAVKELEEGSLSVPLQVFNTWRAKSDLLHAALASGSEDAMFGVLFHLRDTLRKTIFYNVLKQHAVARDWYLAFLRQTGDLQELLVVQSHCLPMEEAYTLLSEAYRQQEGYPSFHTSLHVANLNVIIKKCTEEPSLRSMGELVSDEVEFLERQEKIDSYDAVRSDRGVFASIPRPLSIKGEPLRDTLLYCWLYHGDIADDTSKLSATASFKARFNVSDALLEYTRLSSFADRGRWEDVKDGCKKRSLLRKVDKTHIGFHVYAEVCLQRGAPQQLVDYFLERPTIRLDQKFHIAVRYGLYNVAMQAIRGLKDRGRLEELRSCIRHDERLTADMKDFYLEQSSTLAAKATGKKWTQ